MEEVVKEKFAFLFREGFEIGETVQADGFRNWAIYLYSKKFIVMIVQDRGEVSLRLAPPANPNRKLSKLKYLDAETVIGYISNNIHYTFFSEKYQDTDNQLEMIAAELNRHYKEVCLFFEKPNFSIIKGDFELFRERVREYYLGPYGYKSRKP